MKKIILASGSPRRKELLKELLDKYSMEFEIQPSNVDEKELEETINDPSKLVGELSYVKATDVFDKNKDKYDELIVIGADTIVWFDNKFLGKPKDIKDATNMLEKLSRKYE